MESFYPSQPTEQALQSGDHLRFKGVKSHRIGPRVTPELPLNHIYDTVVFLFWYSHIHEVPKYKKNMLFVIM